jgi:integrase
MSIEKRGKYYSYEFMWRGERIRESTKQGDAQVARTLEAAHRVRLANGEVGIREKKPAPTLAAFLKDTYLPNMRETHRAKKSTVQYYERGAKGLLASKMAGLRLDEITSLHSTQYATANEEWSASTINCGLRVLRIALRLAVEWKIILACPKFKLKDGEVVRERVLTPAEETAYFAACKQPWKDFAIVMRDTGMRPGEVRGLQWERVNFETGQIQVRGEGGNEDEGKSEAASRQLPMQDGVRNALQARWEAAGKPLTGWVFSSPSKPGQHMTAACWHHKAAIAAAKLEPFVPYTLRHTLLTRLGSPEKGEACDVFTLAKIAGHSDTRITARYVHPQQVNVGNAFARLGPHKTPHMLEIVPKRKRVKPAA